MTNQQHTTINKIEPKNEGFVSYTKRAKRLIILAMIAPVKLIVINLVYEKISAKNPTKLCKGVSPFMILLKTPFPGLNIKIRPNEVIPKNKKKTLIKSQIGEK